MAVVRVSLKDSTAQSVTPGLQNKIKWKNKVRKIFQRICDPHIKATIKYKKIGKKCWILDRWNKKVAKECGGGGNPSKLCRRLIKTRLTWVEKPRGDIVYGGKGCQRHWLSPSSITEPDIASEVATTIAPLINHRGFTQVDELLTTPEVVAFHLRR